MERLNLHAIRLNPCPPPDIPVPAIPYLGFQREGQPNRISMHATLWRRETLLQLLHPGESIWEFEIYGTIRSNQYPGGICGCWTPVIHYVMGLNRGRWFRRALRSLARDKIHPDTSVRPVETSFEELRDFIVTLCIATLVRALAAPLAAEDSYEDQSEYLSLLISRDSLVKPHVDPRLFRASFRTHCFPFGWPGDQSVGHDDAWH